MTSGLTDTFFVAQANGGAGAAGPITIIVYMLIFFGVMYVFSIRPQKIKAKKHEDELSRLKKGDEVVLISGIYGEIQSVESESFLVKIAEKTVVKVTPTAVRGKVGSEFIFLS